MAKTIKARRSGGRVVRVTEDELARIEANRTAGEPLEYVTESRFQFVFRLLVLMFVVGALLAQSVHSMF
jgi:hypothetical protein